MSKIKMYRNQGDQNQRESWHWQLEDDNGKAVVVSEARFDNKDDLVVDITGLCQSISEESPIISDGEKGETDQAVRLVHRKGEDGKHGLHIELDGRTVARGLEPLTSEKEVVDCCKKVREELDKAPPREFENSEDDDARQEKSEDRTPVRGIPGS